MRAGNAAERPSHGVESEDERELFDVPAAVVCAVCGAPDCVGCVDELDDTYASGVVAIVPWERPGNWLQRLWQTSSLATLSSQSFFGALPAGDIGRALTFAILVELCAVAGLVLGLIPLLLLIPGMAAYATQPDILAHWLRAAAFGIPGLAFTMISIHAVHGFALDIGARRAGSRQRTHRGLRFGLYSCGWDLVTLPLGILVVAIVDGWARAWKAIPHGWAAPSHASRAYLQGIHGLNDGAIRSASRFAIAATASFVVVLVSGTGAIALTLVLLS